MTKAKKKLTILATPLAAVGHVNGCSGPLRTVLKRGHRVVFLLESAFKGSQAAHGFEEMIYTFRSSSSSKEGAEEPKENGHKNGTKEEELTAGEVMARTMEAGKILGDHSPEEKMRAMIATFQSESYYEQIADFDAAIKGAIEQLSPDLIYHDSGFLYPAIHFSGIPWIRNTSMQILMNVFCDTNEVPPAFSGNSFRNRFRPKNNLNFCHLFLGYPSHGDLATFRRFNALRRELFYSAKYNDLLESLGYDRFPFDAICPESQALTVYACPNELNYPFVKRFSWFNLEVFSRPEPVTEDVTLETLGVPRAFLEDDLEGKFTGRILYLSLGTIGGADLGLMRRLLDILSTTSHKVIVSLGPRAAELLQQRTSLPRNMWGERYLPQTALLPFVDLVITHGGNNTFTEVFACGKPMVVSV